MNKRKICYITGTRADYGLMESTLKAIQCSGRLEVELLITGMHLSKDHGFTIDDIADAGFSTDHQLEFNMEPYTGSTMAKNIGHMLIGFVTQLEKLKPEMVLLLGDRGEMLAGAIAAIHLNIPVVHIHGGERSGTVDEPVRHAISKLSHYHFTATREAKKRLIRMGEQEEKIWVTGAPGLNGIARTTIIERVSLGQQVGFDPDKKFALFVFHPVLQEIGTKASEVRYLLDALLDKGVQVLALLPNSDAGSQAIRDELLKRENNESIYVIPHLKRELFLSCMAHADLMVGNSSAGIIEAASFGTPVINIGTRQNLRERNKNVIDVDELVGTFEEVVDKQFMQGRYPKENIYGGGASSSKIVQLLETIELDDSVLGKVNAY